MSSQIITTTTVYTFDELSDRAKERARDWYRELIEPEEYAESVIEDAVRAAVLLGITIDTYGVRLMNDTTRQQPAVWWALHTQGAGASFPGRYQYAKGAARAIAKEYPTGEGKEYARNNEINRIAKELQALQRPHLYRLQATWTVGNQSVHSAGMRIDVTCAHCRDEQPAADAIAEIEELIRDFADWIYDGIDQEYDYQTADEQVDDTICANEYTFTAEGEREG